MKIRLLVSDEHYDSIAAELIKRGFVHDGDLPKSFLDIVAQIARKSKLAIPAGHDIMTASQSLYL